MQIHSDAIPAECITVPLPLALRPPGKHRAGGISCRHIPTQCIPLLQAAALSPQRARRGTAAHAHDRSAYVPPSPSAPCPCLTIHNLLHHPLLKTDHDIKNIPAAAVQSPGHVMCWLAATSSVSLVLCCWSGAASECWTQPRGAFPLNTPLLTVPDPPRVRCNTLPPPSSSMAALCCVFYCVMLPCTQVYAHVPVVLPLFWCRLDRHVSAQHLQQSVSRVEGLVL